MSIFGDLDVKDIPDDPFYVAPSTYWSTCIEAYVQKKDDGTSAFIIKWQINEPDNNFHGSKLQQYFGLPKSNDMTPDERRSVSFLKKTLRRGFGFTEEEVDNNQVKPSQLAGLEAFVTVTINEGKGEQAGKKFTNVNDVVSKEINEEENPGGVTASTAGVSVGL